VMESGDRVVAGRARGCGKGCAGELVPLPKLLENPDFWVRPRRGGPSGWWNSPNGPVAPKERAGRLAYVCPTCGASHRLVDDVA